jgi:hypothetical protein
MTVDEQGEQRKFEDLEEVRLWVPADRYRAFQRCVWILVHETGRDQLDVMHEVVEDFLIKHGC